MSSHRYHILLASILFAVLTWLSVNLRETYTVVRHLPVVIENLKEGKALKHPVPRAVTVRFSGSGWLITGLYLSPGLKYFIDASTLSSSTFIVTGKDLPEHLKLPFAVQTVDVKPESLILSLDDYTEKRVPVVPRIVVNYHQGYGQVGPMRVTPESIAVGGGRDALEHLTAWHTLYEKFEDLHGSVDETIPMEEPENYSLSVFQKSARIQIDVQPFAEKVFAGIPVTSPMTPSNREVIFVPPKMDVIVRGGIDQLARLSERDFEATVNYQSLAEDSAEYVEPALNSPGEVTVISRKPERFQFFIRKRLQ